MLLGSSPLPHDIIISFQIYGVIFFIIDLIDYFSIFFQICEKKPLEILLLRILK